MFSTLVGGAKVQCCVSRELISKHGSIFLPSFTLIPKHIRFFVFVPVTLESDYRTIPKSAGAVVPDYFTYPGIDRSDSKTNNGIGNVSQKQGIISCIRKGNKPRKYLKNWRPISLLNSSYKIISSWITNRIKKVLDILIGDQQKGLIPGRNISECTREIFDYMWKYQENETLGLLLLIDLEKAFDTLAWDFIHLVFKEFAFPKLICDYIQFFQQGANSSFPQQLVIWFFSTA